MPNNFITSKIAILVDHFHLTVDDVARLTDYQISAVYFHARDENGAIAMDDAKRPAKPSTSPARDALRALSNMKRLMKPANYQEARERLLIKLREEQSRREMNGT